jgi:glycosyltransferase involved in cell wall biosynthesis
MRPILAPPPRQPLQTARMPRFSILTAAYQASESIVECVESALAQTVPPHEVIVVDDGSSDGTADRLLAYRDRIVYVRQENRGAPAASNVGLRMASGDFVSILDADDVYEPERLAALTELALVRPDLDILVTDAFVEVDGKPAGTFFERTPFAVSDQLRACFERCFIAWPAIRRSRLVDLGGFDESFRIAFDWDCAIRLLGAGCLAGAVDEPLLRYRITGRGSLSDDRLPNLRARVRVLEVASGLDLAADERAELDRYLGRRRRRLQLAELEQALRARSRNARRLAVRAAVERSLPLPSRVRAAASALAPGLAARRLDRLAAKTGRSRTKRVPPGVDAGA